jgi:hypothetical protein
MSPAPARTRKVAERQALEHAGPYSLMTGCCQILLGYASIGVTGRTGESRATDGALRF